MPKRKKTALENFFSWKRHKRRMGAKGVIDEQELDFTAMKQQVIDEGEVSYTHGSATSVEEHFVNLRKEFHGKTELEYYHAKLNVLIRREYKINETFDSLRSLWEDECEFLLENLNTRWLISSVDSFVDHSEDSVERALLMNASCLVNTVKLCETERYLLDDDSREYIEARKCRLQEERLPLYDGTSGFAIGTDDTLRNMRWRLDDLCKGSLAGRIVIEVFDRLQQHKTIYQRFKQAHVRDRTAWW